MSEGLGRPPGECTGDFEGAGTSSGEFTEGLREAVALPVLREGVWNKELGRGGYGIWPGWGLRFTQLQRSAGVEKRSPQLWGLPCFLNPAPKFVFVFNRSAELT